MKTFKLYDDKHIKCYELYVYALDIYENIKIVGETNHMYYFILQNPSKKLKDILEPAEQKFLENCMIFNIENHDSLRYSHYLISQRFQTQYVGVINDSNYQYYVRITEQIQDCDFVVRL